MKEYNVPFKVKSCRMEDNRLILKLSDSVIEIPREKISFCCYGVIEEDVNKIDNPRSPIRKMIVGTLTGDDSKKDATYRYSKILYLMDLYIDEYKNIYRFDSSAVNYKDSLEKVELVSLKNFYELMKNIYEFIQNTQCRFNENIINYFQNKKYMIHKQKSINDFELETLHFIRMVKDGSYDKIIKPENINWDEIHKEEEFLSGDSLIQRGQEDEN
jgi:hypothetical protein